MSQRRHGGRCFLWQSGVPHAMHHITAASSGMMKQQLETTHNNIITNGSLNAQRPPDLLRALCLSFWLGAPFPIVVNFSFLFWQMVVATEE